MPIKLINPQTGLPDMVPDDQAKDAYLSNQYGLDPNKNVSLIDPETQDTYSVVPTKAAEMLQAGYDFETPQQQVMRQIRNDPSIKGFGGALTAFTGQAANQLSMGVSDAIADSDKYSKIANETIRDEHPVANIAGGITGFLGSLIYGGPLWKGLGIAGDTAGAAVQGALELGGEGLAKGVAGKIATTAAKYGTEAAAYNLPARLTEDVLGDPDTASDALISGVGHDFLFGAGFGAAGSMVSQVLRAGADLAAGKLLPEGLEQKSKFLNLKAIGFRGQNLKAAAKEYGNDLGTAVNELNKFIDEYDIGGLSNITKTPEERLQTLIDKRKEAGQIIEGVYNKVDALYPNGAVRYGSLGDKMDQVISGYDNNLDRLNGNYRDAVNLKKAIEDRFNIRAPEGPTSTGLLDEAGNPIMNEGQQYTPTNMTFNDAQALKQDLKTTVFKQNEFTGAQSKTPASKGYYDIYKTYADHIYQNLDDAVEATNNSELSTQLKAANKTYTDMKKIGEKIFLPVLTREAGNNAISLSDEIMAAGAAAASGGEAGPTITSFLLNQMRRKYGTQLLASTLGGMSNVIDGLTSKIDGNITGFLKGEDVNTALKASSIGTLSKYFQGTPYENKSKQEQFTQFQNHLQAAADPDTQSTVVGAAVSPIAEQAPNITNNITQKIPNIINYLIDSAPKPTIPESPFFGRAFTPSDRQLSQYERRLNAVFNPNALLDELRAGTLTKETVEATQTCYPALFNAIQTRVISKISAAKPDQAYKMKSKLRLLLGDSLGTNETSQKINILQQGFQTNYQPKPKANSKLGEAARYNTEIDRLSAP